ETSNGLKATKTIVISRQDVAGGNFTLDLEGEIAPGKLFDAVARVTDPVKGQDLTLVLPRGLERVDSEMTQPVPPAAGKGPSVVKWKVRVQGQGRFAVRALSSTGATRSKVVNIESAGNAPGKVALIFQGKIELGKNFTLLAKVNDPVPNQTVKFL